VILKTQDLLGYLLFFERYQAVTGVVRVGEIYLDELERLADLRYRGNYLQR
jgi:hypothetical protein